MIKNYLKIAFRSLWKNKTLSFLNIFGLAIGMACSLLIFLYVVDELSYDRYHLDADKIHRVVKDFDFNQDGNKIPDATTQPPLAPQIEAEVPEVVHATRFMPDWGSQTLVKVEEQSFNATGVWRVDDRFFDVFTYNFIEGDAHTALQDLNSVVMTESAARRYFGEEDKVGQRIQVGNDERMLTGVIEDVPTNSHFHFEMLLPFDGLPELMRQNWNSYNFYTYIKVQEGADMYSLDSKIQDIYLRNQETRYSTFYTQPLTDIHLTSRLKWELKPNGDILYVYIFSLIGFFILLIAAINYINLSTAKSSLRAKEIGVRRVSGADKMALIRQFLLESIILCLMAGAVAILISTLLLPLINDLTQKELSFMKNQISLLYLLGGAIMLGVIAGIFPALYLSSFQPTAILKGLKLDEKGALGLRKVLVVVQFTISIALIVGALIISQQISYIQSAKLGFDKEQVMVIRNAGRLPQSQRQSLLHTIKEAPGVKNAALSGSVLGETFSTGAVSMKGSDKEVQLNYMTVSDEYLEVMGLEIKEGRNFSPDFTGDVYGNPVPKGSMEQTIGGVVLNEIAAKELGMSAPYVGNQVQWATASDTIYYLDVVGVTEDFHFSSLRNEIKPFGFLNAPPNMLHNFMVKLTGDQIPGTVTRLENLWVEFNPEQPLEYAFLDDTFSRLYASEARFQKVFISLVILGIMIACLGLFGLATFAAENRRKEIGIRKVLGASVVSVVALLSRDFLKLVLVALILAIPISYLAMDKWLEDFAYRIEIEWWVFTVAALLALMIAFFTISSQALRAAVSNPVKSIRTE